MNDEELTILCFLRICPETYYSRREVARKSVRRKVFNENPQWADVPLASLVGKRLIERNENGLYRMKKDEVLSGRSPEPATPRIAVERRTTQKKAASHASRL